MSASPAAITRDAKRSRTRNLVLFAAKAVVATVLITWLVRSGALDFRALAILFQRPWLGVADLALTAFATAVVTIRWYVLLGLVGVKVPFRRALHLQTVALFFNVVIPGNVGGDVVKALYVARDEPPAKRAPILLLVFVERLLGLAGLLLLAALVVLARGSAVFGDPRFRPFAITVVLLGAGAVIGPAVFILIMRRAGHHLESWTSGPSRISKLLAQLVAAMRLTTSRIPNLIATLALSMAGHAGAMAMFTLLAGAIGGEGVPLGSIATVFPLGLLTLVLPISPAGIGVGHVAFDRLFAAVGLTGGATVFNVYLIGQIVPSLFFVFPYFALRRAGAVPEDVEPNAPADAP